MFLFDANQRDGRQKAMFSSDNCQFWQLSYNIEGFLNQRKIACAILSDMQAI